MRGWRGFGCTRLRDNLFVLVITVTFLCCLYLHGLLIFFAILFSVLVEHARGSRGGSRYSSGGGGGGGGGGGSAPYMRGNRP